MQISLKVLIVASWLVWCANLPAGVYNPPATGGAPTGAAGGGLSGNYPNPDVAILGAISGANLIGVQKSTTLICDGSTDNLAAMQAAINNRTSGDNLTIYFQGTGTALISGPLSIPSKTTIILDRHLIIKLKNSSLAAGGASFAVNSDTSGGNTDIAIYGGIWDGNNANQTRTDNANVAGVGFRFKNVTRLRMADLTIRNPHTFGVQAGNLTDFIIENVFLDYTNSTSQQDGIHINGPATGGVIRNIIGDANDDHVALNADDTSPYQMTNGTIKNVLVDGVQGITSGWRGVRLYSSGSTLTNVSIKNVGGSYRYDGVLFSGTAASVFSNISVSDINGTFGTISGNAIYVDEPVTSLTATQIAPTTNITVSASGSVATLLLNGSVLSSVTSSTALDTFQAPGKIIANKASAAGTRPIEINSTAPRLGLYRTGSGSDEKLWDFNVGVSTFDLRCTADADNAATSVFSAARSGTTPGSFTFTPMVVFNKASAANAGAIELNSTNPRLRWYCSSAASNGKLWDILTGSGTQNLNFRAVNDADNAATTWMGVTRSGTTISNIDFTDTAMTQSGTLGIGADTTVTSGNVIIATAGKGLQVKGGTNAKIGSGTLSSGTVTVSTTAVTANSRIFVTDTSTGSLVNVGSLVVSAKSAGSGFTVTSTNALDASTFDWIIVEQN